jgi:hypothetical protein
MTISNHKVCRDCDLFMTIYNMQKLLNEWRQYLAEQDEKIDDSEAYYEPSPYTPTLDTSTMRDFSYVFGTTDGEVLSQHNQDKLFYGASSNKPFLALYNLINCAVPKSPEQVPCKCLADDELRALLNYDTRDREGKRISGLGHRGDSNIVNRALSRKISKTAPEYTKKRGKELCSPKNNKEAAKFLDMLGFDSNMLIRHGMRQNKQSALGYFKLLSFLSRPQEYLKNLNPDLMKNQNFVNAADHVLRYMKREFSSGRDREHKGRFLRHLKDLQSMGLPVKSIYGKGGYFYNANNSAMIIDDKYVFVLFSDVTPKINRNKKGKSQVMDQMSKVIANVLVASGKYSKT